MNKLLILMALVASSMLIVACGGDDDNARADATTNSPSVSTPAASATDSGSAAAPTDFPDSGPVTLRLGYFANVTHAQPLVGLRNGIFQQELGPNVTIEKKTFNAGPDVITALFAGEIDASYIGPSPAVNGYVQSDGNDVRIVSGATSGGALLVVRKDAGISTVADLANKKLATPQLGNTQDVALRHFLAENGLATEEHGGNVTIIPTANADSLTAMQQGNIDGAWVPEPWATRLVNEANGKVLVDEKDTWPDGKFATTLLIVRTQFLKDHPDVVERLVRANVKTTQWIQDNPEEAKTLVNQGIQAITTKALSQETIDGAWTNIEPTWDPLADTVRQSAQNAYDLGFLQEQPDLTNIFSLDILNRVLAEEGLDPVSD